MVAIIPDDVVYADIIVVSHDDASGIIQPPLSIPVVWLVPHKIMPVR